MAKLIRCDYCNQPAKLVTGQTIYPHRLDLAQHLFWHCAPCKAWVGCHLEGAAYYEKGRRREYGPGVPLGRLANAELREAKKKAHAAFDPLWKSNRMTRKQAYAWLSGKLNIPYAGCHIGLFSPEQCYATVNICEEERTYGR